VSLRDHDITKTGHIVPDIRANQQVGPYRLIREIGRGGMGMVYLAMRADDVFQKRVAIKILKRGTDTDAIVQRFRNEQGVAVLEKLQQEGAIEGTDVKSLENGRRELSRVKALLESRD
jgi:serine/threonine protein kinase